MKNLLISLLLIFCFQLSAQDAPAYQMYQSIVLTAKDGHGQQLRAALAAHNAKFHRNGSEIVNVWAIMSGPRSGSLLWVKGPLTWSDMDTPIAGDAHMDDWRTNVTIHADMGPTEFWRVNDGMNYSPEGLVPNVMLIRYFDIKNEKMNNARHVWNSIFKLYREKNWDVGLTVFGNQANAGDDRDWAIGWFYDSFTSMDKDRHFFEKYEDMYKIDQREFFEGWNEMSDFEGMEMCRLIPDLSAATANN